MITKTPVTAADISCPNFSRPFLFGINPDGAIDNMFQSIRDAGGTTTKLTLNWDKVEMTRGVYNFAQLDAGLKEAEKQGLSVFILIVGTPDWAKEGSLPAYKALPKREFRDAYTNFIKAAAQRYPHIVRYEFWNEQNGCGSSSGHCGHTSDSAAEYAYWLDATYNALKQVNGSIQLSVGGLDRMDESFVDKLHSSPGGRSYDVFSIHPYNWHGALDLGSVKRLHELAQKPIWITEYGWNVGQGAETSITEAEGQRFFLESISRLESDEFFFVEAAFFHTLGDFSSDPAMGLIDAQGRKRPWYESFKQVATKWCPLPSPTPLFPRSSQQPTPIPTPEPTPIYQDGDTNQDGSVDIFDYNFTLTKYEEIGCTLDFVSPCDRFLVDIESIIRDFI